MEGSESEDMGNEATDNKQENDNGIDEPNAEPINSAEERKDRCVRNQITKKKKGNIKQKKKWKG